MKCYNRLIYKQFFQVSGLCGPQFSSYLPKHFTHHCRLCMETPSLRSKRFQSSYCAKVRAGAKKKIPSPSPVIPFFALVPTFSTNSQGNACYAGWETYLCTVLIHKYGRRKSTITSTSGVHFYYKSSFFSHKI